jgi:hypothetical protein
MGQIAPMAVAPTLLPAALPRPAPGEPESLLDGALDERFRLWDAYGLLPVLCDPARRAQPDACVVRCEAVRDIIWWVTQSVRGQAGALRPPEAAAAAAAAAASSGCWLAGMPCWLLVCSSQAKCLQSSALYTRQYIAAWPTHRIMHQSRRRRLTLPHS